MTHPDPDDRSIGLPPLDEDLSPAQIEELLTEAEESLAQLREEVRQRRLKDDLDAQIPATDLSEARGRWHHFVAYLRQITQQQEPR
ncbi:hypothetical protein [Ornithinimicrobium pratense]|uniref:Uncharacterized protein n=1 Tax=Ornithinimicrobium pratense TaxID=2593973 RepID=A0A5J6V8B5_9MICO|nr:hypothetical protein [Ornithinimicrobium pratense]QFG69584.1 hypothetical protein FY030_13515 [Ornithinimicrobium pratense]